MAENGGGRLAAEGEEHSALRMARWQEKVPLLPDPVGVGKSRVTDDLSTPHNALCPMYAVCLPAEFIEPSYGVSQITILKPITGHFVDQR
jgi:hypothetical protein